MKKLLPLIVGIAALGAVLWFATRSREGPAGASVPPTEAAEAEAPEEIVPAERRRAEATVQEETRVPRSAAETTASAKTDASAEAKLVVEVLYPDGAPVEGAEVLLFLHVEPPTESHSKPSKTKIHRTDGNGRAFLALPVEADELPWLELWARKTDEGLVSATLLLQTPWPSGPDEPQVLRLRPAGLRVRVREADLQAASGERVWVQAVPSLHWPMLDRTTWMGRTGEDGEYLLGGLRPGEYEVSAGDERVGRSARQRVRVDWGEESLLEVVLSASELPLAVAGTLVDEDDAPIPGVPIGVVVAEPDGEWWVKTDDSGRFAWFAEPSAHVRVRARPDEPCERYDPPRIVPFGTLDVLIRRAETVERRSAAFRILDPRGAPVPGAQVFVFYDEEYDELSSKLAKADGNVTVDFCLREGTSWGVHAPGFLDEAGTFDPAESAETMEVRLRPGFERRLRIVDWYSHEPLPGAVVTDGAGIHAVADTDGLVHLIGNVWPEKLQVKRDGYADAEWTPGKRMSWQDDYCTLFPPEEE